MRKIMSDMSPGALPCCVVTFFLIRACAASWPVPPRDALSKGVCPPLGHRRGRLVGRLPPPIASGETPDRDGTRQDDYPFLTRGDRAARHRERRSLHPRQNL
jgi:hypothetical protein